MIKAWLLDADYVTINGKAVVRLWCKKDEDVFVAYDKNFQPYFYVLKNGLKIEDIKNAKVERKNEVISPLNVEEVKMKSLGREIDVYKVYAKHPQHVPKLREYFSQFTEVREADIPFAYRYLIDKDLACMDGIVIEGKKKVEKLRSYYIESVKRETREEFPPLKILAFDCEMLTALGMPDYEKDPIIIISVKCGDFEEIIEGNEREILLRFVELIRKLDPDIIVGYNQDNFDWPYIKRRAEKLSVKLNIGRDGSELAIKGGRPKITGRLNVDLYDIA